MITQCFTCTGAYALLIMLGIKRVENRSMLPNPPRGKCAISCSKSFCLAEYQAFLRWASDALDPAIFLRLPSWDALKIWRGKIIGVCDYAAYTRTEYSRMRGVERYCVDGVRRLVWDEGYKYWWALSNIVFLDNPIPCCGDVGMWKLPADLSEIINRAVAD